MHSDIDFRPSVAAPTLRASLSDAAHSITLTLAFS